ncbi:hypothetical protein SESBI_41672 [Sesbania bispinosa]|nr:hypothetical protein SESBI_41672 [Sesbania bispinosa]
MSGDDLSDSQDLSLNVYLSSDEDTSVTETDSLLGSDDTDSSITSRLPPLQTSSNRVPVPNTPIINLSDEGSPVMNVEGIGDEDPSLSQGLEVHPTDPKPHRVPQTPLSALSEDDRAAVEWLRMQKNIDCCALLENEDNPAGLQALLGNMPPKSQMTKPMDEVAMLKALRAKERKTKAAEKNAATSVECLGTGPVQHADGTNSLEQRKKQKINEGNQPGDTGTRPPPSSSNHNALNNPTPSPTSGVSDKWRALLNDYEGSTSDVCSLFDRRYPIDQIVDKHFNLKEDRTRVQKADMKNLGKKIQSSGSQMAFFDLCVDQYVSSAEKEVKKLLLKNRELTEKLKNHEGDMKTVEKLKTDLQASENKTAELLVEKETWAGKFSNLEKKSDDLQKKNDDLVTKNIDLENKLTKLTSDKEALIVEKDSLTAELEDTKAQVAMQHAAGFEKAINQLQFLYPDLKTDEVGAFKHIVDGKLVDITIDEDEE